MNKATLAFFACLVLLCGAFGAIFATHRWSRQVDGYGFSPPEIAMAVAREALRPSPK